jgi:hypothetical protein
MLRIKRNVRYLFVVNRLPSQMRSQLLLLNPKTKKKTELHGLSARANYTDRETAACRKS